MTFAPSRGSSKLCGAPASLRIGIDLGGTKIEGLALGDDGRELERRRIPAPRGHYDDTVRAVADLVTAMESAVNARGTVGVGIPGAISPATGLIKNANSTWLIGRRLGEDLSRALNRDVRLANDANCFALSEAADGAAAGAAVVFGVIIGTGTGGGVVVNGRIVVGANAIGGEWGHNPLPAPEDEARPGPPCYCGRSGCIETFLSGPALARDYIAQGGSDLTAAEVAARAITSRNAVRISPRPRLPRARERAIRSRNAVSIATSAASPARSRPSSTSSIPMSSCWEAACRISIASTTACRRCGAGTSFPIT